MSSIAVPTSASCHSSCQITVMAFTRSGVVSGTVHVAIKEGITRLYTAKLMLTTNA